VETNKKMDERSSHKKITKTFLIDKVRHFSRLFAGKNNGQEPIWDKIPPGWPSHMTWKNPTSTPKDNVETLQEKYKFLYHAVENIPVSDKEVHNDFINCKMNSVECRMACTKCLKQIKDIRAIVEKNELNSKELLEAVFELYTKISTYSRKRRNEDPVEVPHKKIKTEDQNVNVANKTKQTGSGVFIPILPKSSQAACVAHSTDQVVNISLGLHYASDKTVFSIDFSPQTLTYNPASGLHTINNNAQNNTEDSPVQFFFKNSSPLMHPTSNCSKDNLDQCLTHSPSLMLPTSNCSKDNLDQCLTHSPSLMLPTSNCNEDSPFQCLTPSPSLMLPTSNCNEDSPFQCLTPSPPMMHHTNNSNSQNKSSEDSSKANNLYPEISNNNTLSIESNNASDIDNLSNKTENLEDSLYPEHFEDFLNSVSLEELLNSESLEDNFDPGNQDDNFDPKHFINFPKT
jgi:hypothetical protein